MFLARDVDLGDLIATAKRHSAISNIAVIYERLYGVSSENDLKNTIQSIESLIIESQKKVMQGLVVHSWDDVLRAFDGIKYFSPELLTITILHQQHRDHVAALKSLTSRLLNCTERFSKGEYDEVSLELDSCMTDPVFLDLPSEYRANILTIAGKCAYELEEWEVLDEFIVLLEADYELENALPKILEA